MQRFIPRKRPTRQDAMLELFPHWGFALSCVEGLLDKCREWTLKADQYRHFNVGAALLAEDPRVPRPWCYGERPGMRVFGGANTKPTPDSCKFCAEKAAIRAAEEAGYPVIHALAVAGPNQADDASGVMTLTLTPCLACRQLLRHHPGVRLFTPVVSILHRPEDVLVVDDDLNCATIELHTVAGVLLLHGDSNLPSHRLQFIEGLFQEFRLTYGI